MMGFQKEIKLTQNTFHRGFQTLGRLLETDCFCLDNVMEKKKNSDKRVWTFFIGYNHMLPGCFGYCVRHMGMWIHLPRV